MWILFGRESILAIITSTGSPKEHTVHTKRVYNCWHAYHAVYLVLLYMFVIITSYVRDYNTRTLNIWNIFKQIQCKFHYKIQKTVNMFKFKDRKRLCVDSKEIKGLNHLYELKQSRGILIICISVSVSVDQFLFLEEKVG